MCFIFFSLHVNQKLFQNGKKHFKKRNNRDSSKGFGKDQPMMPVGVILSERMLIGKHIISH